jgi:hypothetical protein
MHFVTSLPVPSPLLVLVGAHGLTDFSRGGALVPPYLAAALLPPIVVTPVFLMASLCHFARDFAPLSPYPTHAAEASMALHGSWLGIGVLFDLDAAAVAALTYMVGMHVPLHYKRQWSMGRRHRAGVVCTIALTLAVAGIGWVTNPWVVLEVPEWTQRLVIAHALTEGS